LHFSLSQNKNLSFLCYAAPFLWYAREIKMRWRRKIAFCSASFALVREPENSIKMINIHQNAPRVLGRLACPAPIQSTMRFSQPKEQSLFMGSGANSRRLDQIKWGINLTGRFFLSPYKPEPPHVQTRKKVQARGVVSLVLGFYGTRIAHP
jgi:hypothetical protein